jgi:hypothetical protein
MINTSSPEFNSFPAYAAKLLRNYSKTAEQIRIAKRFCEAMMNRKRISKEDHLIELGDDPVVRYNLEGLLRTKPAFSGMMPITQEILQLIPAFGVEQFKLLFETDRYCCRSDQNTTFHRVQSVFKRSSDVVIKAAVHLRKDCITLFFSCIGSSSRGATTKHSVIAFSIYSHLTIAYASLCDCILGQTASCAHLTRALRGQWKSISSKYRKKKQRWAETGSYATPGQLFTREKISTFFFTHSRSQNTQKISLIISNICSLKPHR